MAIIWTKLIPRWGGDTIEPPEAKKDTGYIAGDKPPAKWENWLRKGTYEALDETRDVIEGIDTQLAQDVQDLALHKAENVTEIIEVMRDLTLTGTQTITLTKNKIPKSITCFANVLGTEKISFSIGSPTPSKAFYKSGSSAKWYNGSGLAVFSDLEATNRTIAGSATNITKNSFDISWTRTGTGATGTATLSFLITYHGGD